MTRSTSATVARIMSSGGIGVARRYSPDAFYIWFCPLDPVGEGEVMLEVTFNPETLVIGEIETDVLVHWGATDEVSGWLDQLLSEVPVELCPLADEPRLREVLFGENSMEIERVDSAKPWAIR